MERDAGLSREKQPFGSLPGHNIPSSMRDAAGQEAKKERARELRRTGPKRLETLRPLFLTQCLSSPKQLGRCQTLQAVSSGRNDERSVSSRAIAG